MYGFYSTVIYIFVIKLIYVDMVKVGMINPLVPR